VEHQAVWQVLLAAEENPADAWVDQTIPVPHIPKFKIDTLLLKAPPDSQAHESAGTRDSKQPSENKTII
jgi:hypothetical protein